MGSLKKVEEDEEELARHLESLKRRNRRLTLFVVILAVMSALGFVDAMFHLFVK